MATVVTIRAGNNLTGWSCRTYMHRVGTQPTYRAGRIGPGHYISQALEQRCTLASCTRIRVYIYHMHSSTINKKNDGFFKSSMQPAARKSTAPLVLCVLRGVALTSSSGCPNTERHIARLLPLPPGDADPMLRQALHEQRQLHCPRRRLRILPPQTCHSHQTKGSTSI